MYFIIIISAKNTNERTNENLSSTSFESTAAKAHSSKATIVESCVKEMEDKTPKKFHLLWNNVLCFMFYVAQCLCSKMLNFNVFIIFWLFSKGMEENEIVVLFETQFNSVFRGWKVKVEQFTFRQFYEILIFIVGKIFVQLILILFRYENDHENFYLFIFYFLSITWFDGWFQCLIVRWTLISRCEFVLFWWRSIKIFFYAELCLRKKYSKHLQFSHIIIIINKRGEMKSDELKGIFLQSISDAFH